MNNDKTLSHNGGVRILLIKFGGLVAMRLVNIERQSHVNPVVLEFTFNHEVPFSSQREMLSMIANATQAA